MKIINIDINDNIEFKSIKDTETGVIKFLNSSLSLPADNVNNIYLNFNFISPDVKVEGLRLFAIFTSDNLAKPIAVELKNIEIEGEYYSNACLMPAETLDKKGNVTLGVYGYTLNEDNSLNQRLSLTPTIFSVNTGSYNSNAIDASLPTPTVFEIYFNDVKKTYEQLEVNLQEYEDAIQSLFDNANENLKKIKHFNSVAEMKTCDTLVETYVAITLGYYAKNDGGGATYSIRPKSDSDIEDNGSIHFLLNNLVAELILDNDSVTPAQLGAKSDGINDDSPYVQKCLDLLKEGWSLKLNKTYYIGTTLIIPSTPNISIIGGQFNAINNLTLMFDNGEIPQIVAPSGYPCRAENVRFTNCIFNGNRQAQLFKFRDSLRIFFNSCMFYDFKTYGVEIVKKGENHEINFVNCGFVGKSREDSENDGTALYIGSPDNQVSNCVFAYSKWGIHLAECWNMIDNTHFYCFNETAEDGESGNVLIEKAYQTINNCYFDSGILKFIDPWRTTVSDCLFVCKKTPIWLAKTENYRELTALKIVGCNGNNISEPVETFDLIKYPNGNFTNPKNCILDIHIPNTNQNFTNIVVNSEYQLNNVKLNIENGRITNFKEECGTKNLIFINSNSIKRIDRGDGKILSESTNQYTMTAINNVIDVTEYDNTDYRWLLINVDLPKNTNVRTYDILNENNAYKIFGFNDLNVGSTGTLLKDESILEYMDFNTGDYNYYAIVMYGKGHKDIKIVTKY